MTNQFEPATDRQLRAYARRLRQADRTLSQSDAIATARKHEGERATAHHHNKCCKETS